MGYRIFPFDLKVSQKHLVPLRPFRLKYGFLGGENTLMGHCKDAEVELRIDKAPWFVASHINTQLLKEL